jgi:hypothetical protein
MQKKLEFPVTRLRDSSVRLLEGYQPKRLPPMAR